MALAEDRCRSRYTELVTYQASLCLLPTQEAHVAEEEVDNLLVCLGGKEASTAVVNSSPCTAADAVMQVPPTPRQKSESQPYSMTDDDEDLADVLLQLTVEGSLAFHDGWSPAGLACRSGLVRPWLTARHRGTRNEKGSGTKSRAGCCCCCEGICRGYFQQQASQAVRFGRNFSPALQPINVNAICKA